MAFILLLSPSVSINSMDSDHDLSQETKFTTPERRSDVWDHFTQSGGKAICNTCSRSYSFSSSTTTLKRHTEKHQSLPESSPAAVHTRQDQESLEKCLESWIVSALQPFSAVENKEFKSLVSTLDPKFRLPTRQTLKTRITLSFKARKDDLVASLGRVRGGIAITIDGWTNINKLPFLGMTAHYRTSEWKINSIVLSIRHFPHPHTGQAISAAVLEVLDEYDIRHRTRFMTSDNAQNMIVALEALQEEVGGVHGFMQLRCLGHILNLVVQAMLKDNDQAVGKLRTYLRRIRKSSALLQKLSAFCQAESILSVKPDMDTPTRWNSTLGMIRKALVLRRPLNRLSSSENLGQWHPTAEEWRTVESMVQALEPFEKATLAVSGSSYPTLSEAHQHCHVLLAHLDAIDSPMVAQMKDKFHRYWIVVRRIYTIAAMLDPRKKRLALALDEDIAVEVTEFLQQRVTSTNAGTIAHSSSPDEETESMFQRLYRPPTRQRVAAESELDKYLELPIEGEHVNPCEWWKMHEKEFPTLSEVASAFAVGSATSVPCERLFSVAGQVYNRERNRLHPETACILLCLKSWNSQSFE
jgi:zinc finger BED domain-containing protein 1 (E3 SUMO-protein ligase ZBED1)